jgi:CheY-like chemotaxis protein/HPt (histidine-containing phosphotransfer) domain-containing protein
MQMPGMDGEALGKIIKSDPVLAETRLIMMTSLARRGDAARSDAIGFDAYLTKPVRQSDLLESLSAVLSEGRWDAARHVEAGRSTQDPIFKNARILLAEDNITNQQVATAILKKLGFRVDAVADGMEALKALASIPYDLVLMDVQMPEMDGITATREIRNWKPEAGDWKPETGNSKLGSRWPAPSFKVQGSRIKQRVSNIPIIAMTAHAMQGDREKCLEAGMNDYLPKPVTPEDLAKVLGKWLGEKKAEAHAGISGSGSTTGEGIELSKTETEEGVQGWPVFDYEILLDRLMGDEELAAAVTAGFLEDMPEQIGTLKSFAAQADFASIEATAHKIKGAAANIGGESMREAASLIEKAGAEGDADAVAKRIPQLERRFERLTRAIMERF